MTMPLIVLAIGTIVLSVVLTPAWPWLHGYLTGEPAHFDIAHLIQPMLFISLALVGGRDRAGHLVLSQSWAQDRDRPAEVDPLEYAQPALFRFLENKMWIDELYARTIIAFAWAQRAFVRLDGSLFLGWFGARLRRNRPTLWNIYSTMSTSAASMPEWMKRQLALAVWAV